MYLSPPKFKIQSHHIAAVIAFVVFLSFASSMQNGFVSWDDEHYIVNNPDWKGLSLSHLTWMFTDSFTSGLYMPITWLSLGVDYMLWGMYPAGYHLTNVLLHVINGILLFYLILMVFNLRSPDDKMPTEPRYLFGALAGALFFAVHPLRVESVAWITERRDVLSGMFYLLTIMAYLRAHARLATLSSNIRWMRLCLLFFTLSLFSKPWAITLPAILMILDIYPLNRFSAGSHHRLTFRAWFMEKALFVILAGGCVGLTFAAQSIGGSMQTVAQYGKVSRIMQSAFGFGFYLFKTIWPTNLSPLYLLDHRFKPLGFYTLLCAGLVVMFSAILLRFRRQWPWALTSWVCYLVVLLPVLGLFQSGAHLAADRYTYIACMPWAMLIGAGTAHLLRPVRNPKKRFVQCLSVFGIFAVLFLLAALTFRQTSVWKDSYTLWQHTLRLDPGNYIAHSNLGLEFDKRGASERAKFHFLKAIELNPKFGEAYNNLGFILERQGELDDAIDCYRKAVTLKPSQVDMRYNLANALSHQGDFKAAAYHYLEVLRLRPDYARAYNNMGLIMLRAGKPATAYNFFKKALFYQPELKEAQDNIALMLKHRKNYSKP